MRVVRSFPINISLSNVFQAKLVACHHNCQAAFFGCFAKLHGTGSSRQGVGTGLASSNFAASHYLT